MRFLYSDPEASLINIYLYFLYLDVLLILNAVRAQGRSATGGRIVLKTARVPGLTALVSYSFVLFTRFEVA